MPKPCRRVGAVLTVVLLSAAAPAQRQQFERLVQRLLDDLADPTKALDAAGGLERMGAEVVPSLRALLAEPRRYREPEQRLCNVLYVLGRIGIPSAVAAWPDLIDVVECGEGRLPRQALWAISQLAPAATDQQRSRALHLVTLHARSLANDDDGFLLSVVREQLALGGAPSAAELQRRLYGRDNEATAACMQLRFAPPAVPRERAELAQTLVDRLASGLQRPPLPWLQPRDGVHIVGHLATAWRQLTDAASTADWARGVLRHWHPDERLRGVLWLSEHGGDLPVRERGDLVARLWDESPAVATAAARAFAAFGANGLVALPALRRQATLHPDAALQRLCADSADAIVAAVPAARQPVVAAFDAILRDLPRTEPIVPGAAQGDLVEALLFGAQWCDGPHAQAMLDLLDRCGADDAIAVVGVTALLGNVDPAVCRAGAAWLARHASAVGAALDDGLDVVRRAIRFFAPADALAAGIEATAWLAARPGTARDVLIEIVDATDLTVVEHRPDQPNLPEVASTDLRLCCRALATLVLTHPESLAACAPKLRSLLTLADGSRLLQWCRGPILPVELRVDLAPQVRTLAAIALATLGPVPEATSAAADVERAFGVSLADLPGWVVQQRANHTLATQLDRIEAACRTAMGLDDLAWPQLAERTGK